MTRKFDAMKPTVPFDDLVRQDRGDEPKVSSFSITTSRGTSWSAQKTRPSAM